MLSRISSDIISREPIQSEISGESRLLLLGLLLLLLEFSSGLVTTLFLALLPTDSMGIFEGNLSKNSNVLIDTNKVLSLEIMIFR